MWRRREARQNVGKEADAEKLGSGWKAQLADITAKTGDQDYAAKSGTLTFAPGETTKTITIKVNGDSKTESTEYFSLDLYGNSSNSLFTRSRGTGTILNDD